MATAYPEVSLSTCTSARGSTGESFHHCDARVITILPIPSDGLPNARTPASNPLLKSHLEGLLSRVPPDTSVFTWASQQAGPEAEASVVLFIRECNPWGRGGEGGREGESHYGDTRLSWRLPRATDCSILQDHFKKLYVSGASPGRETDGRIFH